MEKEEIHRCIQKFTKNIFKFTNNSHYHVNYFKEIMKIQVI